MATDVVPDGTAVEVLNWVDGNPARARAALEAERAGQGRLTLTSRLETIASKEVAVSEATEAPEAEVEEAEEVPAPEQPTDVLIDPADSGVVIQPIAVAGPDVEVPEDADLTPPPAETDPAAEDEAAPIDAEQTEYLQVVGATNGVIVAINGTAFALNPQTAASLKMGLDKAIVGLNL